MANRRMFSKDIVNSDAFMDMPTSSRELYFQLGMTADDDGFVSPRGIMRSCGASEDDLKVLISKRFVLPFNDGVIVIKHWLINNYIRKDFYRETTYIENKKMLRIKENMAYTMDKLPVSTISQQNVNNASTQVSIGKVSIGKNTIPRNAEEVFDFQKYKKEMEDSKDEAIQLIAYFFEVRGLEFHSRAEIQIAIKRHLRAARQVVAFPKKEVFAAFKKCQDKHSDIDWSLDTIIKKLTN